MSRLRWQPKGWGTTRPPSTSEVFLLRRDPGRKREELPAAGGTHPARFPDTLNTPQTTALGVSSVLGASPTPVSHPDWLSFFSLPLCHHKQEQHAVWQAGGSITPERWAFWDGRPSIARDTALCVRLSGECAAGCLPCVCRPGCQGGWTVSSQCRVPGCPLRWPHSEDRCLHMGLSPAEASSTKPILEHTLLKGA